MMEREYNNPNKIYVEVNAVFRTDGAIIPLSFVFEDGNTYKIDKVIQIDRRASLKAGGIGWRYTFEIQGQRRYIWLEESKWFLEKK